MWGRGGIKGLIWDLPELQCLYIHGKRQPGSGGYGYVEFKGVLRGGDMYLEIDHIQVELFSHGA